MREKIIESKFKREYRRAMHRGKKIEKLDKVIQLLVEGRTLDSRFKDHALTGNWKGCRDCHIEPDWILIYQIKGNELILRRTGSHSDLGLC